jgi:RNA polymerase sigma factor (sigma-70 family)
VLSRDPDGLSDGQLLDIFLSRHEEAAFAALVRRHGPMVLGVCRRVLGNRHEAEDAFQATFLVLLRKASSIRPRQAVGSFLYGVAYRTSLRAKTTLARRRAKEKRIWENGRREKDAAQPPEDWQLFLDEEMNRLPAKYRSPLILCDLQGRTHKEAAAELGWPLGTLSGRLWRARELLARRLTQRGLTLSATVLAIALAKDSAYGSVPVSFGNVSANVVALTQGVLKAMWMTKVRITAALLLAASMSVGSFLYSSGARSQPMAEEEISAPPVDPAAALIVTSPKLPSEARPTAEQLISYLNTQASRVRGLRCRVELDFHHDKTSVGLDGNLACDRPGNVHLTAKILGQTGIDLGSNSEGYWFWASKMEPHILWRGRRAEERGQGPQHWPSSCRPEWLLDVLGIAKHDSKKTYSLKFGKKYLELSEPILSPQGEAMRKVMVFHLAEQKVVQMPTVLFQDANGKVICRADIKRVYKDEKTSARITKEVVLSWPKEHLKATLHLSDFKIGRLSDEQTAALFTSPWSKKNGRTPMPKPSTAIQIDLTNVKLEMRCGEEVMKVSGPPDNAVSLEVLRDQLREWRASGNQSPRLLINSPASIEYAKLKAVLAACRQAGIREIEVCTESSR